MTLRKLSRLTVVVSLLFFSTAAIASNGWELTSDSDSTTGITTWKKAVDNSSLDAFKGAMTVDQSMLTILAVLADIPHFPTWVFHCDAARTLPKKGDGFVYLYIRGIWPVSDRDAVLHSTLQQNPDTLAITVHTTARPDLLPVHEDRVRMPALNNFFVLTPIDADTTHIVFTTYADPGGLIPGWLANFVAVEAPFDTLSRMRERMTLPQYHLKNPAALPNVLPGSRKIRLPDSNT